MISSDNFPDDPYGWLTNQCGHGVVGIAMSIYSEVIGLPMVTAFGVAIVYFIVIEWYIQRLKLFWDSVSDSLHVCFGAFVVAQLPDYNSAALALTGWGAVLAYGYWRRM